MPVQLSFLKSCSKHLQQVEKDFKTKGEQAKIATKEKLLSEMFDRLIKQMQTPPGDSPAKKSFKITLTNLQDLELKLQKLQEEFSAVPKAKDFTACVLKKIGVVTQLLQDQPTPSTTPNKASKQLKTVISLRRLAEKDLKISKDDILPLDKQAAQAEGIQGFANQGGCDCFQNALCQALLTKTFNKNVINRLPDNLRRHFYRKNGIQSQPLRKAIQGATQFKYPLTSQEDPHELFMALYEVLDKTYSANAEPTLPLIEISKEPRWIDNILLFIQKRPVLLRHGLYCFFVPLKLFSILADKISSYLSNKHEEPTEDLSLSFIQMPERTSKQEPNDLQFSYHHTRRWDVTNIAEDFRRDPQFGGDNNLSMMSDTSDENPAKHNFQNCIQVDLDQSADTFDLQQMFDRSFTANGESFSAADNQVAAPWQEQLQFESIPSGLVLHMKRFAVNITKDKNDELVYESVKKFNSAKNIEGQLAISQEHFVESIRPEAPVNMSLKSFVVHKGSSAKSGHYVAFRKVEGDWYYFDDCRCEKVKEKAVMRAAKHAYLYFFEKE
jgi:ubiquitin C-terminal hydrolase